MKSKMFVPENIYPVLKILVHKSKQLRQVGQLALDEVTD
jgi:hypothetical protein